MWLKRIKKAGHWLCILSIMAATSGFSAPKFTPFGVNFSPYLNGQNPATGVVLKPGQVASRLNGIRGYSQWIHTYSVTHGMETAGALAHKAGFKAALQAWLGPENDAAGLAANQQEIANLIAAANRGEADMLVVGSEVLLRGDLTATQLISYMQQVRSSVPAGIPVTTDDIYSVLRDNPDVMAGSDIVMANFYPYWEGIRIDAAIASLDAAYRALAAAAGPKEVLIGETGWPSGGAAVNLAVPTPRNAAYYFLAFNSWAQTNNVNAFYFDAYNEAWKAASEGKQGAFWGIRTSAGALKAGMNLVYAGYTLPEAVFMRQMTYAPGTTEGAPSILLTSIPAYGSSRGIAGVVTGVQPASYNVATYINVDGGWWTKPTWDNPTVPINPDGSFTCNIVTGGYDQDATEIASFVVPANYTPPEASGSYDLPADIFSHSVVYTDVSRPVGFPGSTTNLPVTAIGALTITRSFSASTNATDIVILTGTIPVRNTKASGATVTVNIGSANWQFAPVAKNGVASASGGNWKNSSGKIAFVAGKSRWAFSAKLKCATGSANWDAQGLYNATMPAPGIPVFMPVTINVNGQDYGKTAAGYYTATKGKAGVMTGSSTSIE